MQCLMACPGLTIHRLAGLGALWLPGNSVSSSDNFHKPTGKNHTPHKPPAQPCRSPQCRPHQTYFTLQRRLHLTLQCPMACPGVAPPKLAVLCALWLPSAASSSEVSANRQAKPQLPQTTCPALPQPPVQAPSHLLHTAEGAFDLAVPYDMARAHHS